MPRLTLLVTSPRLPAGLLTRDAWAALSNAQVVRAADLDDPTTAAVAASGIQVRAGAPDARELARSTYDVVWVGSPDGDPGLTDALAQELSALDEPPEVEVLVGSWDPPGAGCSMRWPRWTRCGRPAVVHGMRSRLTSR
ncbi:hypothetical protein [Branchiibius cervicis]|uniref:Uncharacterized protein n=1 Tax=Branchiibius cervicis TaxID=908252 RepID=A0ABW2AWG0_9MICO